MKKVQICYHVYRCHPETCNHDDHNSWWIYDSKSMDVIVRFESKRKAIDFCDMSDLEFTINIPNWSEYGY